MVSTIVTKQSLILLLKEGKNYEDSCLIGEDVLMQKVMSTVWTQYGKTNLIKKKLSSRMKNEMILVLI